MTKPPALPIDGDAGNTTEIELLDESEHVNVVLLQIDLSDREARFPAIECARLTQVRFSGTQLKKPRLSDVRFERCDLSNAEWPQCKINRAEFVDCKLTGFKLVDADVSNCRFQNCVGELVQLHGSKFKTSLFENCHLRGVDFRFCDLESTTFIKCDLRGAEFYDARLKGADLRGCQLKGMKARAHDLKGAVINSQQAFDLCTDFALLLGIDIKDD